MAGGSSSTISTAVGVRFAKVRTAHSLVLLLLLLVEVTRLEIARTKRFRHKRPWSLRPPGQLVELAQVDASSDKGGPHRWRHDERRQGTKLWPLYPSMLPHQVLGQLREALEVGAAVHEAAPLVRTASPT